MSVARRRRIGMLVLASLLLVAAMLASAPGAPGRVRVAGVSLLWWYAAAVAPVCAAAVATALLVTASE